MRKCRVMNKDKYLGTVNIDSNFIEWIEKTNNIPSWMNNIGQWCSHRSASIDRENIRSLFKYSLVHNIEDLVERSSMVGLNDTIWITDSKTKEWKDVNPYKKEFNRWAASMSIDGHAKEQEIGKSEIKSPEYTTLGAFDKKWARNNKGKIVLIKKSSKKVKDSTGNEAFSEIYACQIEKAFGLREGIDYIDYDIRKYNKNQYVSICELATNEDVGFLPMGAIIKYDDINMVLDFYRGIGGERLCEQMLIIDAITMNPDRHRWNYGSYIDNNTLKIIGMFPIFDNNLALCPSIDIRDKAKAKEDMRYIRTRFKTDFTNSVKPFLHKHTRQIEGLANFKFDRSGDVVMNTKRLDFLESLVRSRAEHLLKEA